MHKKMHFQWSLSSSEKSRSQMKDGTRGFAGSWVPARTLVSLWDLD